MPQSEKKKKWLGIVILAVSLLLMLVMGYFIGKPMIRWLSEPEQFRAWVDSHGFMGRLAFVAAMALQVVFALIPGEPFEIGAGYAFGLWEGTVLCMLAIVLGSAVIFWLMHRFGKRFALLFFSEEKLDSLQFLQNNTKNSVILFFLLFIPGTPKDLLTYVAGLTKIPFWKWMLIVSVSRIPSVVTSIVGGDALGGKKYLFSLIVFAGTLLVSLLGLLVYRSYCNRKNGQSKDGDSQ